MTEKKKIEAYLKVLTIWLAMYEMIETVRKVLNQPPNLPASFMYSFYMAAKEEAEKPNPNIERIEFFMGCGGNVIQRKTFANGQETTK